VFVRLFSLVPSALISQQADYSGSISAGVQSAQKKKSQPAGWLPEVINASVSSSLIVQDSTDARSTFPSDACRWAFLNPLTTRAESGWPTGEQALVSNAA
jgi:hypothetical protein